MLVVHLALILCASSRISLVRPALGLTNSTSPSVAWSGPRPDRFSRLLTSSSSECCVLSVWLSQCQKPNHLLCVAAADFALSLHSTSNSQSRLYWPPIPAAGL